MANVIDDRTDKQRETHYSLCVATDSFLSWMGRGRGMCQRSIAAWACEPRDYIYVEQWVRNRAEMKRVRRATHRIKGRKGDHIHIYVVTAGHPALEGVKKRVIDWA
jgi:hypothetical protein